jgi:cytochrome b561
MSSPATADPAAARYRTGAILLHWLIAAGLVFQVLWAWWIDGLRNTPAFTPALHVHISAGLTLLVLILVRVAWRLTHRPPPLPAGIPIWERRLAHTAHFALYLLMLALPLSGWVMQSALTWPIPFWGQEWPHLPIFSGVSEKEGEAIHETLEEIHGSVLAWSMIGLFLLHVAGALKHQFDGHPVLWRMVPFLPRPKG